MKKIEQNFRKIILSEMTFSVIFGICGLIIFLKSEMANKTAGIMIGTFFLIYGGLQLFHTMDKPKIKLFKWNGIFGIGSILIALFIMFNPLNTIDFLNIGVGIYLIMDGIHKFIYFLMLNKVKEASKKIFLTSAILLLFLGILIIIDPFYTMEVTKSVGMFVILENVLHINDFVLLQKRSSNVLKSLK